MKRLETELYIDGVILLQERMELLKNNNARKETVENNTNFTIAMLWCITQ